MNRKRLSNRRGTSTISFAHNMGTATQRYIASISHFDDGSPAELFLNSDGKRGTEVDVNASDGAVAISLALQYGCPLDVLRSALKRNPDGTAQGPLGHAVDLMEGSR